MRIAIDARELQGRATGVGTYLSGILQEWATLPAAAAHELILFQPESGGGTWWEQRTLPRLIRQARADVLFAPGYTAPLFAGVPTVVAIHDVSFAAHPEWFGWREGLRRRMLTRESARRAARVLTISEFSKREIVRYLGIGPEKVEVIYPAAADREGPRRNSHGAAMRPTLEDAAGRATLERAAGRPTLEGARRATLERAAGRPTLEGARGATLEGAAGRPTLEGARGPTLEGAAGRPTLEGAAGRPTLEGARGSNS